MGARTLSFSIYLWTTYPGCISRLFVIAILDEGLEVQAVAYVTLDRDILAVGHNVGELSKLYLINQRPVSLAHDIQAIGYI